MGFFFFGCLPYPERFVGNLDVYKIILTRRKHQALIATLEDQADCREEVGSLFFLQSSLARIILWRSSQAEG